MILRAQWLLTMTGPPVADGAAAVADGRIVAAGRTRDLRRTVPGPVDDLGDTVLMPGLINAHCHLDYTMLRRALAPPKDFTSWISRLNALKRNFDDDDFLRAIGAGFTELRRSGTTTVLNIGSFPDLVPRLPRPVIRTWWFHELIDLRSPPPPLAALPRRRAWTGGFGLSPHAPYTASAALYRQAMATGRPTTTHVAESGDEMEMFLHAAGPLYLFLRSIGRDMGDCGGTTPLGLLLRNRLVNPDTLLVHVNEVAATDLPLLAGRLVAHCPRSHRYFNHRPFPWRRLAAGGARIALGTDSLASNDSLDLFAEMRLLRHTQPHLSPAEILRAATVDGAAAVGAADRLGVIAPGALADLIAVPVGGSARDPEESVLDNRTPIDWMMVAGRRLTAAATCARSAPRKLG